MLVVNLQKIDKIPTKIVPIAAPVIAYQFQKFLANDLKKINSSPNIFVFAD